MFSTRSLGSSRGSTSWVKVRRGSSALTTVLALSSVPSARATPTARPSLVITESTSASRMISAPKAWAARASTWVKPPLPPLWNAHEPKWPSCSPIEWNSRTRPGPLRHRADLGADDAGRGEVALEDVALEVVVEEVGRAAGEHPDRVVHDLLLGAAQVTGQPGQVVEVLRGLAEDVRRHPVEQRLDQLADPLDVVLVAVHGVGVVRRVPHDLLEVLVAVLAQQQVVAVLHRGERAGHQDRHEAVA